MAALEKTPMLLSRQKTKVNSTHLFILKNNYILVSQRKWIKPHTRFYLDIVVHFLVRACLGMIHWIWLGCEGNRALERERRQWEHRGRGQGVKYPNPIGFKKRDLERSSFSSCWDSACDPPAIFFSLLKLPPLSPLQCSLPLPILPDLEDHWQTGP